MTSSWRKLFVFLSILCHLQTCLLSELDEEVEAKLIDPEKSQDSDIVQWRIPDELSTGRYNFLFGSPITWLQSLGLVTLNTYGYYLTLPAKTISGLSLNSTTSTVFPLSYYIAGASLVAYTASYLLSQAPTANTAQYRLDTYDDFDSKLTSDVDDYEDYIGEQEDFNYQYPDSISYSSPSYEADNFKNQKRRRKNKRNGFHKRSNYNKESTNKDARKVSSSDRPAERQEEGSQEKGGFQLKDLIHRYEKYWKNARQQDAKK